MMTPEEVEERIAAFDEQLDAFLVQVRADLIADGFPPSRLPRAMEQIVDKIALHREQEVALLQASMLQPEQLN